MKVGEHVPYPLLFLTSMFSTFYFFKYFAQLHLLSNARSRKLSLFALTLYYVSNLNIPIVIEDGLELPNSLSDFLALSLSW